MKEHQLLPKHVKFKLVHVSSLSKSIACTQQVSYRSDFLQHQSDELISCHNVSWQFVPLCVSALKHTQLTNQGLHIDLAIMQISHWQVGKSLE